MDCPDGKEISVIKKQGKVQALVDEIFHSKKQNDKLFTIRGDLEGAKAHLAPV